MAPLSNNARQVFLTLLIEQPTWIHRRVETIEHFDRYHVRRRVSLDMEIPRVEADDVAEHTFLLPLATLEKKPLKNLDVSAGQHGAVPVLTTSENSELIAGFIASQAELVLGHSPDPTLMRTFYKLARRQPKGKGYSERITDSVTWFKNELDLSRPDHAKLCNHLDFMNLIQIYGSSFELIALVPAHEGERLIVKYAYDDAIRLDQGALQTWIDIQEQSDGKSGLINRWLHRSRSGRLVDKWLQRLGLRPTPIHYPLPGIGSCRSYHIEVPAPEGLEIHDGLVMAWREMGASRDLQARSRCGPSRRAHLHVHSASQGALGRLATRIRPSPAGWLRVAALSSATIGFLLAVGAWSGILNEVLLEHPPSLRSGVAGLLLGVPGILAVLLVRTGEHPLTSRLLLGIRVLLVLSAGLAYSAAATLLIAQGQTRINWTALAIAGIAFAVSTIGAAVWPAVHTWTHARRGLDAEHGTELQD